MKYIWVALLILPTFSFAQTEHREATEEEKKILLPKGMESELQKFGENVAKEKERKIIEDNLIQIAIKNGKIEKNQIKEYVQKLHDHGLQSEDRQVILAGLGQKYFSELQLRDLDKILPQEQQKENEKKFNKLQEQYEKGELTHEELDKEITALDKIISASPVTLANEKSHAAFKELVDEAAQDNTYVKKPHVPNQGMHSPIKITVPKDFTLEAVDKSDPLCLAPVDQMTQLDNYFKEITSFEEEKKPRIKQIYFSWGYNRSYHSKTDVEFKTNDGTFTVHEAVGKDRPSPFSFEDYFVPKNISIPQYNMELGIMLNDKWGIEIKQDHMKWVFDNTLPYEITGNYERQVVIKNDNPTNFWDEEIPVDFSVAQAKKDATWLAFEHSDGYNYVSLGAVYNQNLFQTKNKKFAIDARFGAGAGLMIPKTVVHIHQDQRWNYHGLDNRFHIAGGGVHGEAKIKFTFWDAIYLQASTRGSYIKVKDALVDGTGARMEHIQPIASVQFMGQVGYQRTIKPKKKKSVPVFEQ